MATTDTQPMQPMHAAKAAIAIKDWEGAQRVLAPLGTETPYGVPGFLLARTELELGRPDLAAPLVKAFRSHWPQHVGACVLATRVHLANGELAEAEAAARRGMELEPGNGVLPRLLGNVAVARGAAEAARYIEVIDNGYLRARSDKPSRRVLNAAQQLQVFPPGPYWAKDTQQATIAFFHHAVDLRAAIRNYDPNLIDIATRFGHLAWPRRIQEYVRGKSVLDVGCGRGSSGVAFLIAGARSYVGLDPTMDLDSTRAKNKRARKWEDMGVAPRQIGEKLPAVRLFQSSLHDVSLGERFDTITLHNFTDQLMDLEQLLGGLGPLCKRETDIVLHRRNLNRLPLEKLREITERYFDIVRWDEMSPSESDIKRQDPTINEVLAVARPKDASAW